MSFLSGGRCCTGGNPAGAGPGAVLAATADLSALGIYNAQKYGMIAGAQAIQNTNGLAGALAAAGNAGGGSVWIPSGKFIVNSGQFVVNDGVDIIGQGTKTVLVAQTTGDLFTCAAITNGKGITIKNLNISYVGGITPTHAPFYFSTAQAVRLENIWFADCGAVYFDNNTLSSGLEKCTLDNETGPTGINWVTVYGSQMYMKGCTLRLKNPPPGPTGNTGLVVGSCSTGYFEDNHISQMDYGIKILHGWVDIFFTNNRIDAGVQGIVFAQDSGATARTAIFTGCAVSQNSNFSGTASGVYVDTNGYPAGTLDDVQFNGCTVKNWHGHGLQINSGRVTQVNGGRYSVNGQAGGSYAGICVTGGVSVQISGANCQGTLTGDTGTQPYGIIVNLGSNTTQVDIDHCDLTGNATGPLLVVGSPAKLHVTRCPGYNDQLTPIVVANSMPTVSTSAAAKGFYGPSRYTMGTGVTGYTLNGVAETASPGQSLWLDPYDTILQTGSTNGTWVMY